MTTFNIEAFEQDSDDNSLENNQQTMTTEEVRFLVTELLIELSGGEINYPEEVASVEADGIVDGWLAGNGVNLF